MNMVHCSVCGKGFSEDAVIKMGEYAVCADCKPVFLQRLREGASLTGAMTYAGFWIRAAASIIDWIVMYGVGFVISFLIGLALGAAGMNSVVIQVLAWFINSAIYIAYVTYFLGAFGATPGKMVLGLKVVQPNGEKISYGRAFGRYWAQMVSGIILGIGYIMVAFDAEKRALHDRICDTRVVRA